MYACHVQLCNLMDCSLPGSSVHRIFQAGIVEWVVRRIKKVKNPGIFTSMCHKSNKRYFRMFLTWSLKFVNLMVKEIQKIWLTGGTLRWGNYFVLLLIFRCDQKDPKKKWRQKRMEGNVTSEERWERCSVARFKDWERSNESLKGVKGKEINSFLKPSERNADSHHHHILIWVEWDLHLTSTHHNYMIKKCIFKLLSVW